jgi:hypothetical protein
MKKRNKYFLKEKAINRIKREQNEINNAIRNEGWVELEKPEHNGYYAEWVLREDYTRRADAHVYQEVLDACGDRIWSKTEEFRSKDYKTKKWIYHKPRLLNINKEKYDKLSPSAQKFFYESLEDKKNWRYGFNDSSYACTLTYELVVLISKAYITHRREHDGLLRQMDAEAEKKLNQLTDGHPWGSYGYGKFWRKHEFKKTKMVAERELGQELRDNL